MIKQLVIHLGDRKTGSTSIQTALYKKCWHSDSAKLIYAITQTNPFNHNGLAFKIKENKFDKLKSHAQNIREKLMLSDADFAVISAEQFEDVDPKLLLEFIQTYLPEMEENLRLITYIRPHASRFVSTYAERVKLGIFQGSMKELHDKLKNSNFLIYQNRLRKWKSIFGNKLTIRPFVRSSLDQENVVNDFFNYLFQSNSFNLKPMSMSNESLCLEDLAILKESQRIIEEKFGNQIKSNIKKQFGRNMAVQLCEKDSRGTKIQLHEELAQDVRSFYAEDAKVIDKEFFEESIFEESLIDYTSKSVKNEQSLQISEYLSQDNIRHLHCWTIFLGSIMSSKPKAFLEATENLRFRTQ